MDYQEQIDRLMTASSTIAAQLQELKALRKEVNRHRTSAAEQALRSLTLACGTSPSDRRGTTR
jgi:chaperonin cofactor prefoldin